MFKVCRKGFAAVFFLILIATCRWKCIVGLTNVQFFFITQGVYPLQKTTEKKNNKNNLGDIT